MNPKDIIARTCDVEEPRLTKLLWFLQSYCLEYGGSGRFSKEICKLFPGREFHFKSADDNIEDYPDWFLRDALYHACDSCGTFDDHTELLIEFMEHTERRAVESFHRTNIGRVVWDVLDWCIEERRPCFIEGLEGRGKSASTRAWCEAHRGEARYVSLPGLGTQRDFFNALAVAYGVPASNAKAPNEIRWRLRDAIVRSGLVLVIDEAHGALPERHRRGSPPLIDWIDRDLCNAGVAVALISTPQFGPRLAEFEDRTNWNARQFKRRFSGCWRRLDDKTSEADLTALAQKTLPNVGSKGIKLAVGYAGTFGRDVSGLFDLVRDAQRRARKAKRQSVSYQDLRDAFELDRVPSENAIAEAFTLPGNRRKAMADEDPMPMENEPIADELPQGCRRSAKNDFTTPASRKTEPELVSG